jgi:hypothetical protein
MRETKEFQDRVGRIEGLVEKLESTADPALRRVARELIEALMDLHGAGLEQILEIVSQSGEGGSALVQLLSHDQLIGSLLVLHGLHPEDFETRVRRGLDKVRPMLRAQGARVDILAIGDGTVSVKVIDDGRSNLEPTVREALLEAAPDASHVSIEGGKPAGNTSGFVPLSSLRPANEPVVAVAGLRRP